MAGIIDEIGIEKIINDALGVDEREIVTSGQIVKAIIVNGQRKKIKYFYLYFFLNNLVGLNNVLIILDDVRNVGFSR
ncbi:DUF4277 domain-containing protein [Geminocystis sp. CENA526]|uniref:DUF4277 domain-containing protein n=1 Tax=Geminocystis sp. CENA526 TaxID=1355871 RepID=UPI003D6E65E7